MTLASSSFIANGPLPAWTAHGDVRCPGLNRSPELHWSTPPAGTRSFALVTYDPDARGGWYHWVIYNLTPVTNHLPVGVALLPQLVGITSFNARGYGGPCPPPGPPHHYVFTLYALDIVSLGTSQPLDGPTLLARIHGHVLATAQLIGLYGR